MASLKELKSALRRSVERLTDPPSETPLSEAQYRAGLEFFHEGPARASYAAFILPQLSELLAERFDSSISVLEIGPGPTSVLGDLPSHLTHRVKAYTAYEPIQSFATQLEDWLTHSSPLSGLEGPPTIHQRPFGGLEERRPARGPSPSAAEGQYDLVLFCHSTYGMRPKRRIVLEALELLTTKEHRGLVVIFHRDEPLALEGLVCHHAAVFPTGQVRVADTDADLDNFASFIAGFRPGETIGGTAIQAGWRTVCREMGGRLPDTSDHVWFHAPEIMLTFNRHASALAELTEDIPQGEGETTIKNREARHRDRSLLLRPTDVHQVQRCLQWANAHDVKLTVIGGSHSGQCLWPHVLSVSMSAFDEIHVLPAAPGNADDDTFIYVGAGCRVGDIIRETQAVGVTIPLGARPSVGAGLWLQGGIGHLARRHGLACDAVVGSVLVSADGSQIQMVGHVPSPYRPQMQ